MEDIEDTISTVLYDNQYNYLIYLLELSAHTEVPESTAPWVNTLELFTFGTVSDYIKFQPQFIQLDECLLRKLVKLSVLYLANDHEEETVSIEEILSENGIGQGLKLLSTDEVEESLHELIIDMGFEGIVEAKINDQEGLVKLGAVKLLRDAYNPTSYSLRVLSEQDISNRSLRVAYDNIKSWYIEKLIPTSQELESKVTKLQVPDTKSKKRKSSDNSG